MDHSLLIYAACGAVGAFAYTFPVYLKAAAKDPPAKFALANAFFSVFTGVGCALIFTRIIGYHFPWTVQPEPWPLAMVVGLGSNPLVPIIVKKMEKWANAFEGRAG